MKNEQYLNTINHSEEDPVSLALRDEATLNDIPIISYEGLCFISQIIHMTNTKKMLEIGTAIGYSAISLARRFPQLKITTIERNATMAATARKHIETHRLDKQIRLLETDALNIDLQALEASYDLVFLDAAKAQNKKFFARFETHLPKGGIIIADNLQFHGLIDKPGLSRNLTALVRKIDHFNHYVVNQERFHTRIYPIGDGMSVSIKK